VGDYTDLLNSMEGDEVKEFIEAVALISRIKLFIESAFFNEGGAMN